MIRGFLKGVPQVEGGNITRKEDPKNQDRKICMKPALLNCERESIINMHVTCLSMANMLPNMSNKTYCFVCFISLLEYNCFTTLY